jgi:hypothetical protein
MLHVCKPCNISMIKQKGADCHKRQCSDAEQSFANNTLHAQLHGNERTKGAKQARSLRKTLAGSSLQSSLDMDAS